MPPAEPHSQALPSPNCLIEELSIELPSPLKKPSQNKRRLATVNHRQSSFVQEMPDLLHLIYYNRMKLLRSSVNRMALVWQHRTRVSVRCCGNAARRKEYPNPRAQRCALYSHQLAAAVGGLSLGVGALSAGHNHAAG